MTPILEIQDINDPRIEPYRDLTKGNRPGMKHRFIVEGELLTRRVLASAFPVESVLLGPARLERLRAAVPEGVAVYVAAPTVVREIVGYRFHGGVLSCAHRPANPSLAACVGTGDVPTLVVCPQIDNHVNLGSMIRVTAAMGADALLLGATGCDPFRRQSVRVSMGSVLTLPIRRSDDLAADLMHLKESQGFQVIAAVLDGEATPLNEVSAEGPVALLFGNEAHGLAPTYRAMADRCVRIPMHAGTDSLNVAVAAAVMLYHFGRPAC